MEPIVQDHAGIQIMEQTVNMIVHTVNVFSAMQHSAVWQLVLMHHFIRVHLIYIENNVLMYDLFMIP